MLSRIKAVLALSLVLSLSLAGTVLAREEADVYPLPGEEVFPEGIALDAATGDFFVGAPRTVPFSPQTSPSRGSGRASSPRAAPTGAQPPSA